MLEKASVSAALMKSFRSYMKTASQVIKMVHVKPTIDMKPKLRYEYQLHTVPLQPRSWMPPSRSAASLNERAHPAAAHRCLAKISQTHDLGNVQLYERLAAPSRSY